MPKLWVDSVEAHRRAVREATLDAVSALVEGHGLRSVTMSRIADVTGIGRATLYKYFPDVEALLAAWHERQVGAHLAVLHDVLARPGDPGARLERVLEAYALLRYEHEDGEAAGMLHRGAHVTRAQDHLRGLVGGLLAEGARSGAVRDDVPPAELADFCLHALAAASGLRSRAAVQRLVAVTLAGLSPAVAGPARRPRTRAA